MSWGVYFIKCSSRSNSFDFCKFSFSYFIIVDQDNSVCSMWKISAVICLICLSKRFSSFCEAACFDLLTFTFYKTVSFRSWSTKEFKAMIQIIFNSVSLSLSFYVISPSLFFSPASSSSLVSFFTNIIITGVILRQWVLSEGHKNYVKHWCLMNSQPTFLLLTNF